METGQHRPRAASRSIGIGEVCVLSSGTVLAIGIVLVAERPLGALVGVLLLSLAAIAFVRAGRAPFDIRSLIRTPTLTPAETAERLRDGSLGGEVVAIRGTVRRADDTLFAPLGRRECVAYDCAIVEGGPFGRKPVASSGEAVAFEIRGPDGGEVVVDPVERIYGGRAVASGHENRMVSDDPITGRPVGGVTDVVLSSDESIRVEAGDRPPGRVRDAIEGGRGTERATRSRRIVEGRLRPDDEVTVIGRAYVDSPYHPPGPTVVNDGGSTFVISESHPRSVLRRTVEFGALLTLAGLTTSAVGVWLLLSSFGG